MTRGQVNGSPVRSAFKRTAPFASVNPPGFALRVLRFAPPLRVTEAKPAGGDPTQFICVCGLSPVSAFLQRARLRDRASALTLR